MCYHKYYLFLICGHGFPSRLPLASTCSPPRRSRADADHISPLFEQSTIAGLAPEADLNSTWPSVWRGEPENGRVEQIRGWEEEEEGVAGVLGDSEEGHSRSGEGGEAGEKGETRECGCTEKMTHPLHTYRINALCLSCVRAREQRLARFEVVAIRDTVDRRFGLESCRAARGLGHDTASESVSPCYDGRGRPTPRSG